MAVEALYALQNGFMGAQRSLLLTEDALVQSERTMTTNLVALYKALGGGWDPTQLPPENTESAD